MSREGKPRFTAPTPDERDRIARAHNEADPTTYSELPLTGRLKRLGTTEPGDGGNKTPIAGKDGNVYYKLNNATWPARQQVASRLLKGIINVADVVSAHEGNNFYSKQMPLDKVEESLDNLDILADFELMSLIIDDADHHLESGYPGYPLEGTEHNVAIEHDSAAYYDFDLASFDATNIALRYYLPIRSLRRLSEKIEEVHARYASEDGKALAMSIYEDGQKHAPSGLTDSPDHFYEVLMGRIENARVKVKEALDTRIASESEK